MSLHNHLHLFTDHSFNIFLLLLILPLPLAEAQTVIIEDTDPCFLNVTNFTNVWQKCGLDDNFLGAAFLPFDWALGGYFSMVFVGILILAVYLKYHKVIYTIYTGVLFLPVTFYLFPEVFISTAIILAFIGIGLLLWYAIVRQTKEY